jgi:hypothetical protein
MSKKVLVVGTVRNCSKTLTRALRVLEKELVEVGREPEFFLVESDSNDDTVNQLKDLSSNQANFRFVSFGKLQTTIPDRIQRIAFCRNAYLEELEKLNVDEDRFPHLLVADFDEVNSRIQFPRNGDWLFSEESVFATNQFGRYYDILALRAEGWVEEDYRVSTKRLIADGIRPLRAYLKAVSQKQMRIRSSTKAFEVQSAFGGLAIYPAKDLVGIRYVPELLSGVLYECEHVSLAKSLRARGTKIMIAPSLRNKGSLRHTFASNPVVLLILKALSTLHFPRSKI